MLKPSPAFQFYPQDFLVGTADLTAEEVGGYIRLLCYQWAKGGLVNDDSKLSQLAGCGGNAMASIRHKFRICEDGLLRNDRLEKVREGLEEYRLKQSENAKLRWNQVRGNAKLDAVAIPSHMPNVCSSSSSSSSNKEKRGVFAKPSAFEVSEYAKSIGYELEGQRFVDHYEARGWKHKGGLAMKDWKAGVRTWKSFHEEKKSSSFVQPKMLTGDAYLKQMGEV